ncbi:MAG: putative actin patch assembly and actin polymerization protein [Chrysothrix sp. TS-e1954]|nr:MAG: putative actin patch assembly and actin polymerization protein [Chrysothrix sp. TS-e1954]
MFSSSVSLLKIHPKTYPNHYAQRKPYTAITVHIERLTGPEVDPDSYDGLVELVEVVKIQDSGPVEAARAIRKKLKYGNAHRQLRALTILDGLIQNAGSHFQRTFADEPLLERLRILPRDDMVDVEVRNKCNTLFRQWAVHYVNTPGMAGIASLHKTLPTRSKPQASQSRVLRETEREAAENPFAEEPTTPSTAEQPARKRSYSRPEPPPEPSYRARALSTGSTLSPNTASTSFNSKKDKKSKNKPFNLEKEKPAILQAIASASIASTNLLNALKFVNRETTLVSEDRETMARFDACKVLRRQILRYIQMVESDQWIGSLLSANDELVKALMAFEIMDKSVEDDSDSEGEVENTTSAGLNGAGLHRHERKTSRVNEQLQGLSLGGEAQEAPPAKPPRPAFSPRTPAIPSMSKGAAPPVPTPLAATHPPVQKDDDDDADPFGDQNAI